jgi:DNA-binding MarR family transcriptional regulator
LTIHCLVRRLGFVTDPAPQPTLQSNGKHLELLLGEINALAIRLRHPSTQRLGREFLPVAAREVLGLLRRGGPLAVPEIARIKATSRQNIQIIVNRLTAAGCVSLVTNPAHKKSELISITPAGESALNRTEEAHGFSFEQLSAELSAQQLHSTLTLVRKIRKAIDNSVAAVDRKATRKRAMQSAGIVRPSSAGTPQERAMESEAEDNELPVNLL